MNRGSEPTSRLDRGHSMGAGHSMESRDLVEAVAAAVVNRVSAALEDRSARRLVDVAEASAFLGVPESWLAARARNGEAPCRRLGKYVRFDLVELRAWIDSTTASGPATGCGPVTPSATPQRSSASTDVRTPGVPFVVPSRAA